MTRLEPPSSSSRHASYFPEISFLLFLFLAPCGYSGRMLTDRPRGIFARDVSSTREPRKCLHRMASATTQERRPSRSRTRRSAREYSVFGPQRVVRFSQFDIAGGMTGRGGLNAFGEVATVRITRHPFCKLSTPPALSLSSSMPFTLFLSSSLFLCVPVSLLIPPFLPSRGYNSPKTKRAKSLALIS